MRKTTEPQRQMSQQRPSIAGGRSNVELIDHGVCILSKHDWRGGSAFLRLYLGNRTTRRILYAAKYRRQQPRLQTRRHLAIGTWRVGRLRRNVGQRRFVVDVRE